MLYKGGIAGRGPWPLTRSMPPGRRRGPGPGSGSAPGGLGGAVEDAGRARARLVVVAAAGWGRWVVVVQATDAVAMEAGDDPGHDTAAATSEPRGAARQQPARAPGDTRPSSPGPDAARPELIAFVPGGGCPTDLVYPSRCSSRAGPSAGRPTGRPMKEHARRSGLFCMIASKPRGAGRHSGERSRALMSCVTWAGRLKRRTERVAVQTEETRAEMQA